MPATVTLATTTLTYGIDPGADELTLGSTSGVLPGYRLWIDKESIKVLSLVTGTNRVKIRRGLDGSAAAQHSSTSTVYIARPDWLYGSDPVGVPGSVVPVSPYINTRNGRMWFAQGDPLPEGATVRFWQEVTSTPGTASLGILTQTSSPSSSM